MACLTGLFGGVLAVMALSSEAIALSAFALCIIILLLITIEEFLVFTQKFNPVNGLIFHLSAALCTFGLSVYLICFAPHLHTSFMIYPWECGIMALILFIRILLHPIYKLMYQDKH